MSEAVRAEGLQRRFGPTRVLDSVDLRLPITGRIAILGDNGSGKTTLLRVVAGLLRATDGRISVLGGAPDDPEVRRRVGYLGHGPSLYPQLTALENLRFWGRMFDVVSAVRRGEELLSALGLDPGDRRPVATYSQGMRQRVGLARAAMHAPELLVCDEPFAGLDEPGRTAARNLLAAAPTLLVTTHVADRVAGLFDRTLQLRDGVLTEEAGAP